MAFGYIKKEMIKYEQWAVGPLCEPLMVVRKSTIDCIPVVDAVPVVRCGNCKFLKHEENNDEWYCSISGADIQRSETRKHFCSYGEK